MRDTILRFGTVVVGTVFSFSTYGIRVAVMISATYVVLFVAAEWYYRHKHDNKA